MSRLQRTCGLVAFAAAVSAPASSHARGVLLEVPALTAGAPDTDAVAVRVEDLGERELRMLERARPPGHQLVATENGSFELRTTTEGLVVWLGEFLSAARETPGAHYGRWRSMAVLTSARGGVVLPQQAMWRLSRVEDGTARRPRAMLETLWTPEEDEEPDSKASTLDRLDWRSVRRAIVRATAVLEATTVDVKRRDRVADGIRAGVRILNLVEVGGGYRRVHAAVPAGHLRAGEVLYHSVVFARAGVHLARFPERRFAVPLAVDVGAGLTVNLHVRFHAGLRIRASDRLYVGIDVLNPTYTVFPDDSLVHDAPHWSTQSTVEAGYVF